MRDRVIATAAAILCFLVPALGELRLFGQERPPNEVQVGVPEGGAGGQRTGGAGSQGRGGRQGGRGRGRQSGPPRPVPRTPDGRVIIGSTATENGLWLPGPVVPDQLGPVKERPYQPWARALIADRLAHRLEPHARCKASGIARQFLTPYGVEIVEIPEIQRLYIFDVGGPHTWREVYMDGRTHPRNLQPSYYGHAIGWWEGDTLVIDSTGFNEGFWLDRDGLPHTEQLRTVERLTRTDHDTMRYELLVEDPGAYTAPWTGTLNLRWESEDELFEYVCQEANYAHDLMVGQYKSADRTSPIVP